MNFEVLTGSPGSASGWWGPYSIDHFALNIRSFLISPKYLRSLVAGSVAC